jgi:hypothetical protein
LKKPAKTREELESAIRLEMEDISEWPTDLAISVVPHEDSWKVEIMRDGPQRDAELRDDRSNSRQAAHPVRSESLTTDPGFHRQLWAPPVTFIRPGLAAGSADVCFHETQLRVMIDKISGKVSYAVLSFGGLLGIGDDHYPLPWQALKYDTNLGGYVTGITQDQLRGAPKYADESSWNWSDPATTRSVNAYYGVPVA